MGSKQAARVMIPQKKVLFFLPQVLLQLKLVDQHMLVLFQSMHCISPRGVATSLLTSALKMNKNEVAQVLSSVGMLKESVLEVDGVVEAVVHLSGDESKFVNGVNLVLNGGYSTTITSST